MPADPMVRARAIAGKLDRHRQDILLAALPADCAEYWLQEPIDDDRLAGSDLVLTDIGLAVRAILRLDTTRTTLDRAGEHKEPS